MALPIVLVENHRAQNHFLIQPAIARALPFV
jgi:hypothetical protein